MGSIGLVVRAPYWPARHGAAWLQCRQCHRRSMQRCATRCVLCTTRSVECAMRILHATDALLCTAGALCACH